MYLLKVQGNFLYIYHISTILLFTGGPKLKGVAVFTYIAESLEDKYMCSAYGQDFCSILLRNILSVRKYVVELTTQQWHGL